MSPPSSGLHELGPLEQLDSEQLERATAEGSRRIFRRFVLVVLGINMSIGAAMVVYDVADTIENTEYLLETSGERLVDVCTRLRTTRPGHSDRRVITEASALTGVPMALVVRDRGEVIFSTDPAVPRLLREVFREPGPLPERGTKVEIREALGSLSGAWIVAPFSPGHQLLVIVPRLASEEGLLRYMTIGAAVMGLGLAVAFLFMLATASWVLHQPLGRLVEQLTGALARDIARRSKAESEAVAARMEAERHLAFRENLLDAAAWVGIVATGADGTIQVFNRAAASILGYDEADVRYAMTLEQLRAELQRPASKPIKLKSLIQPGEGEELVVDDRGQERLLQSSVGDITDGEGVRRGRLMVFFDVTRRKQLEAELQLNELQLIQAAKMASLGEMATAVAHELNQPLNNISLLASRIGRRLARLEGSETTEFAADKLERIAGQVQRASRIIDQLRSFGRRRSREVGLIELARPVAEVCDLLRRQLSDRGVELSVELPEDLPRVLVDEGELEQVLINLVNNARDALEQGEGPSPEVTISAEVLEHDEQRLVQLRVADNGPGISAEVAERIFEPFFTTKEVGKGTGLGLSISYGLVQAFGGTIAVESELGEGTVFLVTLRTGDE